MKHVTVRPVIVAGVMSGTSADGVDVALVRISPARQPGKASQARPAAHILKKPRLKLLGHVAFSYPKPLRSAVLAAMDSPAISTAELARLHWRLGEFYGEAIASAQQQLGVRAAFAGVHGQTVYHQGSSAKYLGRPLRCTWQIGEASATAAIAEMPVVSDFRPADVVAGGQAAPLVPMFDQVFFSHKTRNRVLQNLGGIANMTAMPAGTDAVLAFDSGPASCVIDACMQLLYGKQYDRNGTIAARGNVLQAVVEKQLRDRYFAAPPPKSCGREQFGRAYVEQLVRSCRAVSKADADIIATATAISAESILRAYLKFVWPFLGQGAPLAKATDYIVGGGGANNRTLMRMLHDGLTPLGVHVSTTANHGVPTEAKEAMAFALLAWLRWHGQPGNVPAATGAARAVPLGKITLP